ncbi:DUF1810 domain-containing protein [Mucilaginibacter antarcticus]|uniref:DUF1810 domain-containing protein n=1 Tax=Mucilaginibacter antarcticus TaxID=1855725 RepID=A0ABW5XKX8_9SPHI
MDLQRFKQAQQHDYETALTEIKSGRKRSHWMWYIFPQIDGLGMSDTARLYSIKGLQEAGDYLTDKTLGIRLISICEALLNLPNNNAHEIFGSPDDLKLKSSMTLFDAVPATFPIFARVLDKFFGGERDLRTLELLKAKR